MAIDDALGRLVELPYVDTGFAKVDIHRELRCGFPEVVYGQGKTPEQVTTIVQQLASASDRVLVTKAEESQFEAVRRPVPDASYQPVARMIVIDRAEDRTRRPGVMVVCGGTSDIPIAEEAATTAEVMGNGVERAYDVGVAGVHRLLDHLPRLRQAKVVVVVAGMEGALPSVVGGLVAVPVIAVPTSVGYGASFGGLTALLAMLNSCAAAVSVVNIDNGFGAGYIAALINR
ncbi:MAG: nickel pincer cofactor biosynthesis protein LarB [Chloroflexota bacterium]|nr:nickel pincer cofactor biosynthesis protein LarB [Chloroflexota bacterium]